MWRISERFEYRKELELVFKRQSQSGVVSFRQGIVFFIRQEFAEIIRAQTDFVCVWKKSQIWTNSSSAHKPNVFVSIKFCFKFHNFIPKENRKLGQSLFPRKYILFGPITARIQWRAQKCSIFYMSFKTIHSIRFCPLFAIICGLNCVVPFSRRPIQLTRKSI